MLLSPIYCSIQKLKIAYQAAVKMYRGMYVKFNIYVFFTDTYQKLIYKKAVAYT